MEMIFIFRSPRLVANGIVKNVFLSRFVLGVEVGGKKEVRCEMRDD